VQWQLVIGPTRTSIVDKKKAWREWEDGGRVGLDSWSGLGVQEACVCCGVATPIASNSGYVIEFLPSIKIRHASNICALEKKNE
jgi:hypothetical protein